MYCQDSTGAAWPDQARAEQWNLDGVGNWREWGRTDSSDTTSNQSRLNTSFNEYHGVGGATYEHDANGNLTLKGDDASAYAWDPMNRMSAANPAGSNKTITYLYDTQNRRAQSIQREAGVTGITTYRVNQVVYNGWQQLEETTALGVASYDNLS